jgi:hypothetical protein
MKYVPVRYLRVHLQRLICTARLWPGIKVDKYVQYVWSPAVMLYSRFHIRLSESLF